MAFIEVRREGRLVRRKPIDDVQARAGYTVRLGGIGSTNLFLGQTERIGDYDVSIVPQEAGDAAAAMDAGAALPAAGGEPAAAAPPAVAGPPPDGDEPPPDGRADNVLPELPGYEIVDWLGEGGMGAVWRAVQMSTKRPVALKLMVMRALRSPPAQARFAREVELAARLEHPNIARVYDSGLRGGEFFYAMELVEGQPLDRYAARNKLSLRRRLELVRTVALAVQHAHQRGVIHRDLKPSNILVSEDGQPHLLDFGLAKATSEAELDSMVSLEGQVLGTPAFMSPEQAKSENLRKYQRVV